MVEPRPGVKRHVMVPDEAYAPLVREVFRLYIARGGAKAVARELNQRGLAYRTGVQWTKDLVLNVIEESAAIGTYWWGRRRANRPRPPGEWLALKVAPIVDQEMFELANRLRSSREPARAPGRATANPHLLSGLLRCGRCGASYQLETSGKKLDGTTYRYSYYNCRNFCRAGKEVCSGYRVPTQRLDAAVLAYVGDRVCRDGRVERLASVASRHGFHANAGELAAAWRTLITTDSTVARGYLLHLVERIEVRGSAIVVTARTPAMLASRENVRTSGHPEEDSGTPTFPAENGRSRILLLP